MEHLIGDWIEDATAEREKVILAGTNADVTALNCMAQEALKSAGRLGTESVSVGKGELFAGDRVLLTKNSPAFSVMNGDRGVVRHVDGQMLGVELDSGRLIEINTDNYAHVVSEQMTDREMTYVQASRARGDTRQYVSEDLCEVSRHMARSRKKEMAVSIAGPSLELTLQR